MAKFDLGIMFDNETFGLQANAILVETSMVAFDLNTGKQTEDEFDPELKYGFPLAPQQALGRIADVDTFVWWLKQAKTAQSRLHLVDGSMLELKKLLVGINQYIQHRRNRALNSGGKFELWSRGFMDVAQLESIFLMFNIQPAWRYNEWRDLRTIMAVAQVNVYTVTPPANHVQHDSLSDCHFQVKCYRESLRALGEIA